METITNGKGTEKADVKKVDLSNTRKYSWHGPKQIWMIIITAIIMLIDSAVVGGQTNTVIPAFAQARGWDASMLNVASGAAALIDGIGILFWARFTRKNAKVLCAVTMFISAALLLIRAQTDSASVFMVMMILLAICSSAYNGCCAMTLTANWWPTKKGVVLGFSTMGVIAMQVVYVPIMPVLYAKYGLFGGEAIIAAIIAVVGLLVLLFVKDTPEEAGETPDGMPPLEAEETRKIIDELHAYKSPYTFGKLIKDPNSWKIALSVGLPLMAAMTFIASTIPALIGWGYSPALATTVFAVGGVIGFAGSFIFGVIDQKWGTKKASMTYAICMIIAIIFTFFMPQSLMCVWVGSAILFASNGSGRNLLPSFIATKYGRWDYPAAYQIIGTIGMICPGVGIMLTGLFRSYTNMLIFDIVILVIALICSATTDDSFIGKKD